MFLPTCLLSARRIGRPMREQYNLASSTSGYPRRRGRHAGLPRPGRNGHGSVYWVLGGAVKGGRIVGEQVKVEQATLFQNRDWPVLTDYRALFSALFARGYGLDQKLVQQVFPGVAGKELGLV
jgi:hypothetical protein